MKLGNVISTALVSSAVVLMACGFAVFFSWMFGNGIFGAFTTLAVYWAMMMGTGVLISMEQRSAK